MFFPPNRPQFVCSISLDGISQAASMKRSYENAIQLLKTRKRQARPPMAPRDPAKTGGTLLRGVPNVAGMKEWLQTLGHSDNAINNLNIIHITGTKGKGSTCAFARSFLRAHGSRTGFPRRVGLYTSPDLQSIRERIQINDKPITEELFTRYFFEVWERLMSPDLQKNGETRQPRYLQFIALLAFHTFIKEGIDATIVEVHHGGEFDVTNLISKPVVTGITSLGMDHVAELGPTIENIAWHKAGIMKTGAPAFSAPQEPGPAGVISKRAGEKETTVKFVSTDATLPVNNRVLGAPVQRLNCSIALEMTRAFLQLKAHGHTLDSNDVASGVESFSWNGRFEIIEDGQSQWFIDGAHNSLSLQQAGKWFATNANASSAQRYRVLIFSHLSKERDGADLVRSLAHALSENNAKPNYVIFTTYQEREDGLKRIGKQQRQVYSSRPRVNHFTIDKSMPDTPFPEFCDTFYVPLWKELDPQAEVSSEKTIEGAIKLAKRISAQQGGMQCFVTGSLHLVGGSLSILRPAPQSVLEKSEATE